MKRSVTASKWFFKYFQTLGMRGTHLLCEGYVLPSLNRTPRRMHSLERFFEKFLSEQIEEYQKEKTAFHQNSNHTILWVCWFQGVHDMPELVRMCINSMKARIPDEVRMELITIENYKKYVDLPTHLIRKFQDGMISFAHFSDLLRFSLLSKYGGMWLDATVFVSQDISLSLFERPFFTLKHSHPELFPHEPSRAQWCGFIWAGAPSNPLFRFVRDGLYKYWEKYDVAIDYIFFDYIILVASKRVPAIKEMMGELECSNDGLWEIWRSINQSWDESTYGLILSDNTFHKLTYKGNLLLADSQGHETVYAHLLKTVRFNDD